MTQGRIRLHVYLARAGVAARRKCEQLMTEGRVAVNGRTVQDLGTTIDPQHDKVMLDGRRIAPEEQLYILLHKPRGYVTTVHDPEGRPTVMSLLGEDRPRLFPVGRLDFNTDGVLLLTNDGDLANHLMHPRYGVAKTYQAKLQGELSPAALAQLAEGVRLEDGSKTQPAAVRVLESEGKHPWIEITIKEGKNRQVHRMAEAVGNSVVKLSRVRYGPLTVEDLRPGRWRLLTAKELGALRALTKAGVGAGANVGVGAGAKAGGGVGAKAKSQARAEAEARDGVQDRVRVNARAGAKTRAGAKAWVGAKAREEAPRGERTRPPRTKRPRRGS